jgi:hypothetical protein
MPRTDWFPNGSIVAHRLLKERMTLLDSPTIMDKDLKRRTHTSSMIERKSLSQTVKERFTGNFYERGMRSCGGDDTERLVP